MNEEKKAQAEVENCKSAVEHAKERVKLVYADMILQANKPNSLDLESIQAVADNAIKFVSATEFYVAAEKALRKAEFRKLTRSLDVSCPADAGPSPSDMDRQMPEGLGVDNPEIAEAVRNVEPVLREEVPEEATPQDDTSILIAKAEALARWNKSHKEGLF